MENYFIENLETGKIELYFEKSAYMALDENQKREIKSNFLFSRYSSAWISRCKYPNLCRAKQTALSLGLEDAGEKGERLSFEDQEKVRIEKAERRADRYEWKADRADKKGDDLQKPIEDMHGDIAFFTQPNINTSAGRAFTRQRNNMWNKYEQGMKEHEKADYYRDRAETARKAQEIPSIDFCQRRIDEAESAIRKLNKSIAEFKLYLAMIEKGEKPVDKYGWEVNQNRESIESNIKRWSDLLEAENSKKDYYKGLIDQQGGVKFSKENIKPGYIVKLRQSWKGVVLVTSTGPKNIRYKDVDGGGFELTASYAEIVEVVKAEENTEKTHPFEVGEVFTVKEWNGNEYADKEYKITKVTADKVTVKSGSDRAKAIKPRRSYDGKSFVIYVNDGMHGYYTKAI